MPKVSVGLPVYNGQRYLAKTLDSLLNQTFDDFEIIISDNASTDDTNAICRDYAARDSRIRYYRNETNIGAMRNHNLTFQRSSGIYFRWNGNDDICQPQYLERCVTVLDNDPSVVLSHSRTRLIGEDDTDLIYDQSSGLFTDKEGLVRIEKPDRIFAESSDAFTRFRDALVSITTCHHILGLMRSDVLRRTNLFGSYYRADRALLIEVSLYGRFQEVPEELFLKREHRLNSRGLPEHGKVRWAGRSTLMSRVFPKGQEYRQIVSAVLRSPLSPAEKAKFIGFGLTKASSRIIRATAALRSRPA